MRKPPANEKCFFAIIRIIDMKTVYCGTSDWQAARKLNPGTVHGMGSTDFAAVARAEGAATVIRKVRSTVQRE